MQSVLFLVTSPNSLQRESSCLKRVQCPRLLCSVSGGCESKGSATQVLSVWKDDLWRVCSGGRVKLSCCLSFKSLPQVSHGFGADQWEDDVIVLLALEPVDCCHLQRNTNVHGNIKDMLTKLQQANAFLQSKQACAFYGSGGADLLKSHMSVSHIFFLFPQMCFQDDEWCGQCCLVVAVITVGHMSQRG